MKLLTIIIIFLAALFLQWSWDGVAPHTWGFGPPLVPFFVIILFWRMKLSQRMWLGGLAGASLDIISLHPWGTYIGLFFWLAILTAILQLLLTNTESRSVQGISSAVLLAVFYNLVYPLAFLINFLRGTPQFSNPAGIIFIVSLLWAIVLPLIFMICARILGKFNLRKISL